MSARPLPTCCADLDEARKRFGRQVDHLLPFYHRTDPLADKVVAAFAALPPGRGRKMFETALAQGIDKVRGAPRALRDLFEQVTDVPFWVDWDQLDRRRRRPPPLRRHRGRGPCLLLAAADLLVAGG